MQAELPGRRAGLDVWVGEGTEIHPSVELRGPVVVGRGCRIGADAVVESYTVLGDSCIVEPGASIRRSILWSNVFVGQRASLLGCTVGRGVTVKDGATLSEGVVIGDRCFVGSGAVVGPDVKVWPDKTIEAGANLGMSLIWGVQWPGALFGPDGIVGLANIEITPEFALKLGAAYGASLDKGDTVTTSRDAHPASRMLNRALICGLVSVGCNVLDLRLCPAPVARYTVRNGQLRGGVHCSLAPSDARAVHIGFFDGAGLNTSRSEERRVEHAFFREDFRRTHLDDVGLIEFPSRILESYTDGFVQQLDQALIARAGFRVVVDYLYGSSSSILPGLLNKLGVESVAINAYLDTERSRAARADQERGLAQLSGIVTTLGAQLGVMIDHDAERLVIVDDQGQVLRDQRLLALMSLLVLHHTKNAVIAVPITAPGVLESLAQRHRGTIVRTKTDGRSLMQTAWLGDKRIHMAGCEDGGFIFPSFQPSFDALHSFARLLELLAREGTSLSQVAGEIPAFYQHRRAVECPRLHKGRVMRGLIEASRRHPLDLIEGLKIYREEGWVLILPDPVEPALQLVSESTAEDLALALADEYQAQVAALVAAADPAPRRLSRRQRAEARAATPQHELVVTEDRAFFFWAPGRYLGVRAVSLQEFVEIVTYIDKSSLDYHMRRGDFTSWLEVALGVPAYTAQLQALQEQELRGEELRTELLRVLRPRRA